jgi:fatty-acid desaturase
MFGRHGKGSSDQSRDNTLLAVLLFGEGLHNFHHRNPHAAVNAPLYLDAGGALLLMLERLGVVWNVRR